MQVFFTSILQTFYTNCNSGLPERCISSLHKNFRRNSPLFFISSEVVFKPNLCMLSCLRKSTLGTVVRNKFVLLYLDTSFGSQYVLLSIFQSHIFPYVCLSVPLWLLLLLLILKSISIVPFWGMFQNTTLDKYGTLMETLFFIFDCLFRKFYFLPNPSKQKDLNSSDTGTPSNFVPIDSSCKPLKFTHRRYFKISFFFIILTVFGSLSPFTKFNYWPTISPSLHRYFHRKTFL